ncbi:MAG TPA: YggS family pyridoxal phosphate-dependent enzyme [Phycisphaerales bacterium]|nr:YggS family pyridoxal phosphate-dependent enzyme [Phycisphaerales bacterium]
MAMARTTEKAGKNAEPTLKQRYASVRERVAEAARRSGRTPESIMIIAVTKYAAMDQVRELVELGHTDLGENHVQSLVQRAAQIDEFLQRRRQLSSNRGANLPKQIRWHMIGHLQRNKVRKVLGVARLIHSVDSLRLAEEIQAAAGRLEQPVEVLVQVNAFGEKSKFGIAPAAARHLIDQIDTMLHLRVRGLMCMAPETEDQQSLRPVFERTRELFEELRRVGSAGDRFDILSMGMTSDFEVAIESGANMVRIGSAIFGDERAAEALDDDSSDDSSDDGDSAG